MSPFFSIVIPTYNRAAFLPRIIQSIQGQTFQNYEAIFVDDGSTDNSKDIISSFSASDKRIKYLYQQNKERGAARNTGIQAAKADYIVLVDSDDELHEQYLNYLHDAISGHPQVDFFACHFKFKDGDRIYNSPIENEKQDLLNYTFFLHGNPLACNFCFRKSKADLHLFEEDRTLATMEDWVFLIRNLRTSTIYIIQKLGLYMHHHATRSMQQNKLLIERRLLATELLCKKEQFSEKETKMVWGYSYYFCSIHAYLDFNRRQSLRFLLKAISLLGVNLKFAITFIKYIVGKRAIQRLQLGN